MHGLRTIASAILIIGMASSLFAVDQSLLGKWSMTEEGETYTFEFKADGTVLEDGEPSPMKADNGVVKFDVQPGMTVDGSYKIQGNTLTITLMGESMVYQRVGAAPAAPSSGSVPDSGNPLGSTPASGGGNPLARGKSASAPAWAGTWSDGNLTLVLDPEAAPNGNHGTLSIGGVTMVTTASADGNSLTGEFAAGGATYMWAATLAGDRMDLQSDGMQYALQRQGAAPPSNNPLAAAGRSTPATAPVEAANVSNWFQQPDNGFDVPLPGDFRMLQAQGGGFIIGSDVTPGMAIVFPVPNLTDEDLAKGAAEGYHDNVISVANAGGVYDVNVEGGHGKIIEVEGTFDGQTVKGLLSGYVGPPGVGLLILAVTTPEQWPQLQPFAMPLCKGVRLYAPQVSDKLRTARAALAGHSLVYSYSGSTMQPNSDGYYVGSSTQSFLAWHCCANGRGRFEGMRTSSFQGGGVIGSSETPASASDGTWSLDVQGNDFILTFQFDDGGTQSWPITTDANEDVWVDGKKVKVTTDSICQ